MTIVCVLVINRFVPEAVLVCDGSDVVKPHMQQSAVDCYQTSLCWRFSFDRDVYHMDYNFAFYDI